MIENRNIEMIDFRLDKIEKTNVIEFLERKSDQYMSIASEETVDKESFDFPNITEAWNWLQASDAPSHLKTFELADGTHNLMTEDITNTYVNNLALRIRGSSKDNVILNMDTYLILINSYVLIGQVTVINTNEYGLIFKDSKFIAFDAHLECTHTNGIVVQALNTSCQFIDITMIGTHSTSVCRIEYGSLVEQNGFTHIENKTSGGSGIYMQQLSAWTAYANGLEITTVNGSAIRISSCSLFHQNNKTIILTNCLSLFNTNVVEDPVTLDIKHSALTLNGANIINASDYSDFGSNDRGFVMNNADSTEVLKHNDSGTTAERPTITSVHQFFDTTLGKPIWYDGTNWVDATGITV